MEAEMVRSVSRRVLACVVLLLAMGLSLVAVAEPPKELKPAVEVASAFVAEPNAPSINPVDLTKASKAEGKGALGTRAEQMFYGPVNEAPVTQEQVQGATLNTSFAGPDFVTNPTYNGGYLFIPPDPIAAAGPNHVVSVVNCLIEWRPKTGAAGTVQSLQSFFAPLTPANSLFDPKVIYDQYAGRFLVVALEVVDGAIPIASTSSRILLAVSQTSDPTAGWWFTAIDAKITLNFGPPVNGPLPLWADYPGIGLDDKAVYITTNYFLFAATGYSYSAGSRLRIVDKGISGGFYSGGAASVNYQNPYALSTGSVNTTTQPAQMFGALPANMGTFLVAYSGLNDGSYRYAEVIGIENPLSPTPTFTAAQFIPMGTIAAVDGGTYANAPQLGSASLVNTNDRRALQAIWRDNALWATFTVAPASGPDANQVTAHWLKMDTTNVAGISLADQGNAGGEDIGPGTYTFFPSIAVNSCGTMALGFAASGPSVYPGAYYAGRLATDAPGALRASQTLHAGTDWYLRTFGSGRNRWGDYSGISVDPADGNGFWVFNEYATSQGTCTSGGTECGRWATQYGAFHFCEDVTLGPLSGGVVGMAYSGSVAATPAGTYTYTLINLTTLPPGLSLDGSTGAVTGTPTLAGAYSFTIQADDGCSCLWTRDYTVNMVCPTVTVTPATLADGIVGTAYTKTISASGGTAPYAYTVTGGSLPPTLSLNPATGVLSGIPTAAGTFNFTITATDIYGCSGSQAYTVTMACPVITLSPTSLGAIVKGAFCSKTITATGGTSPYTFAVTGGTLPTGYTLSPGGVLSGTASTTGSWTFTVMATDTYGCQGSRSYTLATYDYYFLDDYGRSRMYLNKTTGAFRYEILSGPGAGIIYEGVAQVLNAGTLFKMTSGPWTFYLTLDPYAYRVKGYLYRAVPYLYSSLSDMNWTNDTGSCN
jgi:hypothetical protein